MDIVFVILDITRKNGIERVTSLLANLFTRKGHKVKIISLFKENACCVFELDERVETIFLNAVSYDISQGLWYRIRLFLQSYVQLRKYTAKLFLSHSPIFIGQCFFVNILLWGIGKAKNAIACEHFKYGLYSSPIRIVRNFIYSSFAQVVVLTENDARCFQKQVARVTVIPNMACFELSALSDLSAKRIITVGRLHFQKGYDLLIEAAKIVFEKHPDWQLDIYGEGELKNDLSLQIKQNKLEKHVFLRGYVKEISTEYLKSSIYVLSSRYEGLPMVLLEALSCGLPVVAFACPEGPVDLLKPDNGILVEAENVKALGEALNRMVEHKELRKKYAVRGLQVVEKYSPENIYRKWADVFSLMKRDL